jgi:DNA-binding beta-propeller fold protein YncE
MAHSFPANLMFAALLLAASGTAEADTIYVSNIGDSSIRTVDENGVMSSFANNGDHYPSGLAFDSAGNLYVGSSYNNSIIKFTPGGAASVFASTGMNGPVGMAFDSAGNLYVTSEYFKTIVKFTPDGVGSVFASGLNEPSFIAIIPNRQPGRCWSLGSSGCFCFAPARVGPESRPGRRMIKHL